MINQSSHRSSLTQQLANQNGLALPIALLLTMVLALISGVLFDVTSKGTRTAIADQAIMSTYLAAEGGIHSMIGEISGKVNDWKNRRPDTIVASGYETYDPSATGTGTIVPSCVAVLGQSFRGCERHFVPIGGGVIKAPGRDEAGEPNLINADKQITEQLLDVEDFKIGGLKTAVMVERIRRLRPSLSQAGLTLNNGLGSPGVQMRLTSRASRSSQSGVDGVSTIVALVEIPAS